MPKEHVTIPDDQAQFIQDVIASGQYQNLDEVISASILLLEEQLTKQETQEVKLRAMLEDALAEGVSDRTPREAWEDAVARHRRKNA